MEGAASVAAAAEAAERFFEASPPLERQQEAEAALDDFLVRALPRYSHASGRLPQAIFFKHQRFALPWRSAEACWPGSQLL